MTIIGLVGRSGAGKDTVAAFLAPVHLVRLDGHLIDVRTRVATELHAAERAGSGLTRYLDLVSTVKGMLGNGAKLPPPAPAIGSAPALPALRPHAVQVALADPMKVFMHQVYDMPFLTLWGPSEYRNQDTANGVNPRKALQQLGTEWGRAMWEGTWVAAGIRFAQELLGRQHIKKPKDAHTFAPNWVIEKHDLVVFSDIRFQNEVDMIHEAGGKVWRIRREDADAATVAHASEVQDLTGVDWDLHNTGTLTDLRTAVQSALQEAGL